MNFRPPALPRVLSAPVLLIACAIGSETAVGQTVTNLVDTDMSTFEVYHQLGGRLTQFQGGRFTVNAYDGYLVIDPLSEGIAYVAQGSFDGLSGTIPGVSSVVGAKYLASFVPDQVLLSSAPYSKLPRPLSGFTDSSVYVFWDLNAPTTLKDYYVTMLDFERRYELGEVQRYYDEVVPGSYTFSFPKPGTLGQMTSITYNMKLMPAGYPGRNKAAPDNSFRVIGLSSGTSTKVVDPWATGMFEMDPRVFNTIYWRGVDSSVASSSDKLYISLIEADDATGYPTDETGTAPPTPASAGPPTYMTVFPPVQGVMSQVTFSSGANYLSYRMPPLGYNNTGCQIGSVINGWLVFHRYGAGTALNGNATVTDNSQSWLTWPIRLVDTWEGFQLAGVYPIVYDGVTPPVSAWRDPGTGSVLQFSQRTPSGDLDGDGFTNYVEWAAGTRINDATSKPGGVISFATSSTATTSTSSSRLGAKVAVDKSANRVAEVRFPHARGLDSAVKFEVQYSTDAKSWQTIPAPPGNLEWNVRDDGDVFVISSKVNRSTCFFRSKISSSGWVAPTVTLP